MTLKIRKENYTAAEIMFLFIWTFYSVCFFVTGSELGIDYDVEMLSRFARYATILMQLFMLICLKRYRVRDCLKYMAVFGFVIVIEFFNSDSSLLVYVLFIILAQYADIKKILRYDIILKSCTFIIIVGMCATGVTSNYTAVINGTYKQSFGFSHPNTFTVYVLVILVEWLCVRYEKMKWYEWMIVAGSALVTAQIGGGRSSVYTFGIVFLLFVLASLRPKWFFIKPVKLAFIAVTPLMAIVSFWAVSLYDQGNAAIIALNKIMTNRISMAARFLNTYKLGAFGQEIEYVSSRESQTNDIASNILDNAYIRCALDWGIIALIVIVIAYSLLFYNLLKKQRIEFALFCLFFVLLGIGETYMLKPIYNLSLLCLLGLRSTEESVAERKRPYPKRTLVFKL